MRNRVISLCGLILIVFAPRLTIPASAKQPNTAKKETAAKQSAPVKPATPAAAATGAVEMKPGGAGVNAADPLEAAEAELTASDTFFRSEGAHFENSYETWELLGEVSDQDGAKYDFAAFFSQSGGAYMNMRFGHVSFHPEGGEYFYSSMNPGVFLKAATNQLKLKLSAHPDNQKVKDALDRIEKKDTPHFELFNKVGDIFRTILYINYGKTHFIRVSRNEYLYSFGLSAQGNEIKAVLSADGAPLIFDNENAIPTSLGENGFKGYTFPALKISGTLVTADHKVKIIKGRARFVHLWGEPDKVSFSRFSNILMTIDNKSELSGFTFMLPDGTPLSKQIFIAGADGVLKASQESDVVEGEYWTSELSDIKYPGKWTVKTPDYAGEITLADTKHEFTILEGIGSFYFGPCNFKGVTTGANPRPAAGSGLCKMVAPEKP